MSRVAVGYIRASTTDQALTPSVQLQRIESWCESNNLVLSTVHEDLGESGAKDWAERPALRKAIAALQILKDAGEQPVLVVATRCRLARSTMVAAGIYMLCEEMGVAVEASDGVANGATPEDVLFRTILDAFNQYERARIVLRTRAGREIKRQRGEFLGGGVPFGMMLAADGKTLVPNQREQAAILYAVEKRKLGWSLRSIGENMVCLGYHPRKGGTWTATAIKRLLSKAEVHNNAA